MTYIYDIYIYIYTDNTDSLMAQQKTNHKYFYLVVVKLKLNSVYVTQIIMPFHSNFVLNNMFCQSTEYPGAW